MDRKTFIHDDRDRDCGCPESPESYKRNAKTINLAIQGGGTHGAYAWGILDPLLEDGRIRFEGISATSAGSILGWWLHGQSGLVPALLPHPKSRPAGSAY